MAYLQYNLASQYNGWADVIDINHNPLSPTADNPYADLKLMQDPTNFATLLTTKWPAVYPTTASVFNMTVNDMVFAYRQLSGGKV